MNTDFPALPDDIPLTVRRALEEDIGTGDITASLIAADTEASASIISREHAVLCGIPWASEVLKQVDAGIRADWLAAEGSDVKPNQALARFHGPARSLLSAERCMLNFLQTLSATATISRHYASKVKHTGVRLLDTRKTIPGLRTAQKYAVRTGGCFNHRMGLFDAFLIKENHISACGSISNAVRQARIIAPGKPVEVEVETFEELKEALAAAADIVMLDNFSMPDMRKAVAIARSQSAHTCKLEASGGINEETLVAVAETGVDFISMGILTKDVKAIDLSMRFERLPSS
ncbi:MAG: carboxylating nicotinate-nucleotide diphosphorylase [Pseudohongiella sp.]|nr:carboxylating nicotinate-nucleotide diphosphorylase [Pseudohongiella sp.]MDO9520901.1 carboxylating nicotinate-nucleotide diphosphorylase [Pseudohongiella sp.]